MSPQMGYWQLSQPNPKTRPVLLTGPVRIKCTLVACMPFELSTIQTLFQRYRDADRPRQEDKLIL